MLKVINYDGNLEAIAAKLDNRKESVSNEVNEIVLKIIDDINKRGDEALFEYCLKFDGYKIKPYEIEKVILDNKMVENVAVVSYYDDRQKGLMPRCNLVVKKNLNEEEKLALVKEIVYSQIIANPTTNSRQIPSKFIFRDRLPLTKNNKVDYKLYP